VTGFVTAFPTHTLRGRNWEVDLVAVQPASQRQGIATELIKAAVEGAGGRSLDTARALAATDNPASQRAFTKAGFTPEETLYCLLLYEIRGFVPRPLVPCPVTVRDLALSTEEAGAVLRLSEGLTLSPGRSRLRSNDFSRPGARATEVATTSQVRDLLRSDDVLALASKKANEILVAVREGEIVGFAELLYVETLLYRGIWLESLIAQGADREIQAALISEAVERAKRKRLDEIGCLVRTRKRGMAEGAERAKNVEDHVLREALVGQGFGVVNEYYIFRRDL
ncbi:MAG: GNAT family N-acetyltransferase, partial [Anaerolineae bacterium]|nr:GNAT family N-acetyltransferase [Anaerolineae bacterium]